MGEPSRVLTFTNGSDEAFRKAILDASVALYSGNPDKDAIELLSTQATLMVDALWNATRVAAPDASSESFKALLVAAAEIVTTGQHIVDEAAKSTTPGTDAELAP